MCLVTESSESCAGSVELDPFHSKLLLTEGLFLKCCVLEHFLLTFSPTCCYPFPSHDFETFFASYNFQLFSIQYFRQLNEITEMQGSWAGRLLMDKINLSFLFATAEYSRFVWFTSIWTSRICPVLVVSPSLFFNSTPLTFRFSSRFLRLRGFSLKSLDPKGSLRNCLKAERNLLVRR